MTLLNQYSFFSKKYKITSNYYSEDVDKEIFKLKCLQNLYFNDKYSRTIMMDRQALPWENYHELETEHEKRMNEIDKQISELKQGYCILAWTKNPKSRKKKKK